MFLAAVTALGWKQLQNPTYVEVLTRQMLEFCYGVTRNNISTCTAPDAAAGATKSGSYRNVGRASELHHIPVPETLLLNLKFIDEHPVRRPLLSHE